MQQYMPSFGFLCLKGNTPPQTHKRSLLKCWTPSDTCRPPSLAFISLPTVLGQAAGLKGGNPSFPSMCQRFKLRMTALCPKAEPIPNGCHTAVMLEHRAAGSCCSKRQAPSHLLTTVGSEWAALLSYFHASLPVTLTLQNHNCSAFTGPLLHAVMQDRSSTFRSQIEFTGWCDRTLPSFPHPSSKTIDCNQPFQSF